MNQMNMNNMNTMNMMNMNNPTMNMMNMNNMNNPTMNMMNMNNMNNMNMMNMNNMGMGAMDPTMFGQNCMNPGMMNNPMMMGGNMGMGFNNPMMGMGNPMMGMGNPMMGMGNPMMGNNMGMGMKPNLNMMTPQQREEYKKQQRYLGYLYGKKMAEEKRKAQQGQNAGKTETPVETKPQITPDSDVTIKFNKGGTITEVKVKGNSMIAELISEYYSKTNNQGPFKYKGRELKVEDCSTIIDNGMNNDDEITVG